MRDDMGDWVEANACMAKVLKDKGYDYQYLFCRGAGHSVGNAQAQFLPHALEWTWKGYKVKERVTRSRLRYPGHLARSAQSFTC